MRRVRFAWIKSTWQRLNSYMPSIIITSTVRTASNNKFWFLNYMWLLKCDMYCRLFFRNTQGFLSSNIWSILGKLKYFLSTQSTGVKKCTKERVRGQFCYGLCNVTCRKREGYIYFYIIWQTSNGHYIYSWYSWNTRWNNRVSDIFSLSQTIVKPITQRICNPTTVLTKYRIERNIASIVFNFLFSWTKSFGVCLILLFLKLSAWHRVLFYCPKSEHVIALAKPLNYSDIKV